MTKIEFPQYSEKAAKALEGAADLASGLAGFLAIEHVEVGAGFLHARCRGTRRVDDTVRQFARRRAVGTL